MTPTPAARAQPHPFELPAATHSYLERAAASLREAMTTPEVPLRYASAHVSALRATAALLAARATPAAGRAPGPAEERLGAARRGGPRARRVGGVLLRRRGQAGGGGVRLRAARSPSGRPTTWSATPTGSSAWSRSPSG